MLICVNFEKINPMDMKRTPIVNLGLIVVTMVILLSSCGSNATFTKRYHNRGFNIGWGGGGNTVLMRNQVATQSHKVLLKSQVAIEQNTSNLNGSVLEVRNSKRLIMPEGQLLVTDKKSSNRSESVVVQTESFQSKKFESKRSPIQPIRKTNVQNNQRKNALALFGDGKSQILALLLCLFFGYLGIHRFYLGYPLQGLIQLLVLGFGFFYRLLWLFCLIWVLFDLIRIFTGDLQPRDGNYYDDLNF